MAQPKQNPHFATRLTADLIKKIKLHALHRDVSIQIVTQEAFEQYFSDKDVPGSEDQIHDQKG